MAMWCDVEIVYWRLSMTSIVDRSGKQRTLLIVGVTVCVLSFAGLAFAGQQGQEGSAHSRATRADPRSYVRGEKV